MTSKAKSLILGVAALACAAPAMSQEVVFRDDNPIFPATGVWWTANDGAGRWGVVLEGQESDGLPDGQLAVTIFSYESANTQRQAWYTSAQGYAFNANWRLDGFIGDIQLDLVQSAGGTCLLCQDNQFEGEATDPDVSDDASITFLDTNNAILTVGGVGHQLTKAQFGGGVGASYEELFTRPYQIQFEASNGSTDFRFIDFVEPLLSQENITFQGTSGWNTYGFTASGEINRGGGYSPIVADFEIIVNDESNEFFLNMSYNGIVTELKLFSFNRHMFEGRGVSGFVPNEFDTDLRSNALLISAPSMNVFRDPGNAPYPFRTFGQ